MNPRLTAALEYGEQGFDPLPVLGKKPCQKMWNNRQLSGPGVIKKAWKRWPDANIGLRTGNRFIVLDVDPRSGGDQSLERLCDGRPLPETAMAMTGGGGQHYWFRTPASEVVRSRQGLPGFEGIDVKGQGGFVVVEPSIHPETSREYVWTRTLQSGIAECPGWILEQLSRGSRGDSSAREFVPLLDESRPGPAEVLADELIVKFPVPGYGHRNDLMVKCVGSVIGRGYGDATVMSAVRKWWVYFHDLGRVLTPPTEAHTEIGRSIGVIRASPRFGRATGEIDHKLAYRKILLAESKSEKIRKKILDPRKSNTKRGTIIHGRLSERFCISLDEFAFIEALIVHVTHKAMVEPDDLVRMTDGQVRIIVADRYPQIAWDGTQFERLKSKYVSRRSKEATRHELLLEVEKGDRKGGEMVGTPSVYRQTGITEFLEVVSD